MPLHIQDGCAPIVGYILGGLQESEITMLRRMLARLNQTMGPLRKWLKILSMDRGYWGTDLFCELKQDYGIDFVSRVRDDYVTSLRPGRHGVKVRGFYRGRWGIENQGFRSLSQTWDIDRPAGHSYGAVLARLVFVFMIYNARHLFEKESQHRPDYAEQLRQMRSYGPGISLAGAAIVVLTASGYCCALTARELLKLQRQRLQKAIQRGLAAGRPIAEILRELDSG